jgi:hypothetical protein
LPNVRQHVQFGLAVDEMCSALKRLASSRPTAAIDKLPLYSNDIKQHVEEDWRSWFHRSVRWRQLSEPQDPVWWINGMHSKSFKEGFGLQTPIVNGQWKTIRYYRYVFIMHFMSLLLIFPNFGLNFPLGT